MAVPDEPTCVETQKGTLHVLNILLAFIAAVCGMAASASFSGSESTLRMVPFMIGPNYSYDKEKATVMGKTYYGLSGLTYWAKSGTGGNVYGTYSYIDSYNGMNCGTNKYKGFGQYSDVSEKYITSIGCDGLMQCSQVGKVSMAFVIMGFLMAIISMICSKSRREADTYSKKLMSIIFSFAALLCSLISFVAFGACVRWFNQSYKPVQDANPSTTCLAIPFPQTSNYCGSMGSSNFIYPGIAAALSIANLSFFIIVFALNIAMPARDVALAAAEKSQV